MNYQIDIETTVKIDQLQESDLAKHVLECIEKVKLSSDINIPLKTRDVWYWFFHNEYEKGATFRYYVIVNSALSQNKRDALKNLLCTKMPWGNHAGKVEALLIQVPELTKELIIDENT